MFEVDVVPLAVLKLERGWNRLVTSGSGFGIPVLTLTLEKMIGELVSKPDRFSGTNIEIGKPRMLATSRTS